MPEVVRAKRNHGNFQLFQWHASRFGFARDITPQMSWKTIEKPRAGWQVVPNLLDYEQVRAAFSWEAARRELDGLPAEPA